MQYTRAKLRGVLMEQKAGAQISRKAFIQSFLILLILMLAAGVLTLRGSVPYRQLRQIAESIVGRVEGVEQVVNALQVCDPYAAATGSTPHWPMTCTCSGWPPTTPASTRPRCAAC